MKKNSFVFQVHGKAFDFISYQGDENSTWDLDSCQNIKMIQMMRKPSEKVGKFSYGAW